MKCPHCGQTIAAPFGWIVHVYAQGAAGKPEVDLIILSCSNCSAILGAVNKPKD